MINVRPLQSSEVEGFLTLMTGFYSYAGDSDVNVEATRKLFEKAVDPESNFHVFVASHGEKLVGLISLTIGESSYKVSSFAWADDFYVDEAHRSQGIGRKLISAASEFAKRHGCSNILVGVGIHEADTLKFYEKNGFKDMQCKLMTLPL